MNSKNLVLVYGTGSDTNELALKGFNGAGLDYELLSYTDFLEEGRKHNLDSQQTIVRLMNPWEDERLLLETESGDESYGRFVKLLKNVGGAFPNSYFSMPIESVIALRSKDEIAEKMFEYRISHPEKYDVQSKTDLEKILMNEKSVFFKPSSGTNGNGTGYVVGSGPNMKLETSDNSGGKIKYVNGSANKFLSDMFSSEEQIIYQQNIDMPVVQDENGKDKKFDVRMWVVDGKVVFSYARTSDSDKINTNISQGAESSLSVLDKIPKESYQRAQEDAIRAADAFDLKFAGVDLIFDGKKFIPYVLELNAFPGVIGPSKFGVNPYEFEAKMYKKMLAKNDKISVPNLEFSRYAA